MELEKQCDIFRQNKGATAMKKECKMRSDCIEERSTEKVMEEHSIK